MLVKDAKIFLEKKRENKRNIRSFFNFETLKFPREI